MEGAKKARFETGTGKLDNGKSETSWGGLKPKGSEDKMGRASGAGNMAIYRPSLTRI
jgi:hypothetical protein